MAYETIELAVQAGVAIVTLNRPDRLNSFTVQMHEELADALDHDLHDLPAGDICHHLHLHHAARGRWRCG